MKLWSATNHSFNPGTIPQKVVKNLIKGYSYLQKNFFTNCSKYFTNDILLHCYQQVPVKFERLTANVSKYLNTEHIELNVEWEIFKIFRVGRTGDVRNKIILQIHRYISSRTYKTCKNKNSSSKMI